MNKCLLLVFMIMLAGCALSDLPETQATPALPVSTKAPAATTAIPAATKPPKAYVDLEVTISDSDTEEPVVADTVWLNDEVAYRRVSRFILFLDTDYPLSQDGHEIRIRAAGYAEWSTRMRTRVSRSMDLRLPVHLHRVKPQSLLVVAPS